MENLIAQINAYPAPKQVNGPLLERFIEDEIFTIEQLVQIFAVAAEAAQLPHEQFSSWVDAGWPTIEALEFVGCDTDRLVDALALFTWA